MLFFYFSVSTKSKKQPPDYNSRTLTTLICLNPQEKANEKAIQELLKNNEAITKAMNQAKEQLEQMREVRFWRGEKN